MRVRKANALGRIFYFAPVTTDGLNSRFGQSHHVGPACNKALRVARALRSAAYPTVIVSGLPEWRRGEPAMGAYRADGVPLLRIFSIGRGPVKRAVQSLSFAAIAISCIRREDRVLLYNYFPEYICAAAYLKLVGRPVVLDVEDAPRSDERGLRGWFNRTSFKLLKALTAPRYVTVSNRLAHDLGLKDAIAVYGAAASSSNAVQRFSGERVHVLFGGAILPDTGLHLFQGALELLHEEKLARPIDFHVTGFFDDAKVAALASYMNTDWLTLTSHSHLSSADYRNLLERIDVGLCLKLPSSKMGQTTFPSKVIEYANSGILVCSTIVSDVPDIFDSSSAVLIDESPASLARALVEITRLPNEHRERAERGRKLVNSRFSETAVGKQVGGFLFA